MLPNKPLARIGDLVTARAYARHEVFVLPCAAFIRDPAAFEAEVEAMTPSSATVLWEVVQAAFKAGAPEVRCAARSDGLCTVHTCSMLTLSLLETACQDGQTVEQQASRECLPA